MEETNDFIQSGHENINDYDMGSIRTITLDESKGIKALVGCPKGHYDTKKCEVGANVLSYLFSDIGGWTMTGPRDGSGRPGN